MNEANICGVNHLDADIRLPPRKRHLAGLKKEKSFDCTSSPSPISSISTDFSNRLHNLLISDSKSLGHSLEEIVDASRSAALAAAKVAAAAKAAAEQKAAVAAKAAAAAKRALELVCYVSERTTYKERCMRKNKPKKHVPVKLLYKKRQLAKNCETDEELARRLHRAMNSPSRISKNSLSSDWKIHNNNNHKKQPMLEKTRFSDESLLSDPPICEGNAGADEVNCGGSILEVECNKADCSEMERFPLGGEAEAINSKKKHWQALEDTGTIGRKRGRIKQKKLSLTQCTSQDHKNLKEDPESRGCSSMGEPKDKSVLRNMPFLAVNPPSEGEMSVEAMSIWKCKEFKAPSRFAESKAMQSLCSNPKVTEGPTMVIVNR